MSNLIPNSKLINHLSSLDLLGLFSYCLDNNISFSIKQENQSNTALATVYGGFDKDGKITTTAFNIKLAAGQTSQPKLNKLAYMIGANTIAVVGPDGSGKTTLIDGIKASPLGKVLRFKRFKRYFRRPLFYILRHEPRNVRDEKMLWLILPLSWLTFTITRMYSTIYKPMLLDRYFYDYMIKKTGNDDKPLRKVKFYKWWTTHIPRPRKLIVAYCQAEIVHQRKDEMTVNAINKLYRVYLDQVKNANLEAVLFCHTGLDPEVSCQHAVDFLAKYNQ